MKCCKASELQISVQVCNRNGNFFMSYVTSTTEGMSMGFEMTPSALNNQICSEDTDCDSGNLAHYTDEEVGWIVE